MRGYVLMICDVFFFKQKTSCDMRISDWSSDVCSSDLGRPDRRPGIRAQRVDVCPDRTARGGCDGTGRGGRGVPLPRRAQSGIAQSRQPSAQHVRAATAGWNGAACTRSEEHTSELQSLMRISYAVFCLKKKKITTIDI